MSQPKEIKGFKVPFPEHSWGSCVPLSPQRSLLWSVWGPERPVPHGASIHEPAHPGREKVLISEPLCTPHIHDHGELPVGQP